MTLSGATHEAVKGLSGSPILLLVAVLNIAVLILIFYIGASQRDERAQLTRYLIECQKAQP